MQLWSHGRKERLSLSLTLPPLSLLLLLLFTTTNKGDSIFGLERRFLSFEREILKKEVGSTE